MESRRFLAASLLGCTNKKQVAAVTALLNARRDNWFDPQGIIFATSGYLELRDAHGKLLASIDFGSGGMYQSRPTMTYRDSVKVREFEVLREPGWPGETDRDAVKDDAAKPDDCDEASRRPPPRHIALPPRSDV